MKGGSTCASLIVLRHDVDRDQLARHIVEIKGAIDRIKEQVQNVE